MNKEKNRESNYGVFIECNGKYFYSIICNSSKFNTVTLGFELLAVSITRISEMLVTMRLIILIIMMILVNTAMEKENRN